MSHCLPYSHPPLAEGDMMTMMDSSLRSGCSLPPHLSMPEYFGTRFPRSMYAGDTFSQKPRGGEQHLHSNLPPPGIRTQDISDEMNTFPGMHASSSYAPQLQNFLPGASFRDQCVPTRKSPKLLHHETFYSTPPHLPLSSCTLPSPLESSPSSIQSHGSSLDRSPGDEWRTLSDNHGSSPSPFVLSEESLSRWTSEPHQESPHPFSRDNHPSSPHHRINLPLMGNALGLELGHSLSPDHWGVGQVCERPCYRPVPIDAPTPQRPKECLSFLSVMRLELQAERRLGEDSFNGDTSDESGSELKQEVLLRASRARVWRNRMWRREMTNAHFAEQYA